MTALTQSLDSIPSRYQRLPCLHCRYRLGTQARGLCRPCYNDLSIRHSYPVQERPSVPWAKRGVCVNCHEERVLRARGLCCGCYQIPEVKEAAPVQVNRQPKKDDGKARLGVMEKYPDSKVVPKCPCEKSWDGECPECERVQRAGMVIAEKDDDGNGMADE